MESNEPADLVNLEDHGAYAVIKINRPEKRNAMNRAARIGLMNLIEKIRGQVSVVVLTGVDQWFCAGIDLKESRKDREEGRAEDPASDWNEVNLAIRRHPAIFIAAVNGIALGGGSTLINVCDLAIAAEEAEIGMPELSFATYPGLAGPAAQLALSRKHAAWLILTAQRISGSQAKLWGLVNECVPREDLLQSASDLAERLSAFDSVALAESKKAMDVIPHGISDWRQMFEFGARVNTAIRAKSVSANKRLTHFGSAARSQNKDPKN